MYSLCPYLHGILIFRDLTLAIDFTNNTLERSHKNYIIGFFFEYEYNGIVFVACTP
jgi:hypothetical protein